MPIDTWFPLAIYYEDLFQAEKHKDRLLKAVEELRSEVGKRTSKEAAWTGDLHGAECIHLDPLFSWITEEVEDHTWKYLAALGYDTEKIDLYFQRSWPVVSGHGQYVAEHAHFMSHLSAVYYIDSPLDGDSGCVQFKNISRQNDLTQGLAMPMADCLSTHNELNSKEALYEPREGRLLIFPSKQIHSTGCNTTRAERVSLAFDMVLTAPMNGENGRYNFLPPGPHKWRRLKRD